MIVSLLVLFSFFGNLTYVNADKPLPSASLATGAYPKLDFVDVIVFSSSGPQTVTFPSPTMPVKILFSTVTSYVSNAQLYFVLDGIEYSYSISPNSNTQITFEEPITISNVRISIDGRGYIDDAGHVGYIYAQPELADSDGDGIPDSSDECPSQAENFNGYQDTDGCPDTVPFIDVIVSSDTPLTDEFHSITFTERGAQTKYFPNPENQLKAIYATVTTYVRDAKLFFTTNGTEYSFSIPPNSNTLLTFVKPLSMSNVGIVVEETKYSDDRVDIGYIYAKEISSPIVTPKGEIISDPTGLYELWLRESGHTVIVSELSYPFREEVRLTVSNSCAYILDSYDSLDTKGKEKALEDWTSCANGEIESGFLTSELSKLVAEQRENINQLKKDNKDLSSKFDRSEQNRINDFWNSVIISIILAGFSNIANYVLTRRYYKKRKEVS